MPCAQDARCPIRVGDPCSLCHPGASGPETCGLVYLVMCDPDLREELLHRWAAWTEKPVSGAPSRRSSAPGPAGPAGV